MNGQRTREQQQQRSQQNFRQYGQEREREGAGNLVPAQEERQYVRFFLRFCVLLLVPPSVIFEVRIKALNAAINQLPTAVAVAIVSARSESKQLSCVSLICCSDLDTKKKQNKRQVSPEQQQRSYPWLSAPFIYPLFTLLSYACV